MSSSVGKAWRGTVHPQIGDEALSEMGVSSERVCLEKWRGVSRWVGVLWFHLYGSLEYVVMDLGTNQRAISWRAREE